MSTPTYLILLYLVVNKDSEYKSCFVLSAVGSTTLKDCYISPGVLEFKRIASNLMN